jgi:putative ABC transport system ATP-binding protein
LSLRIREAKIEIGNGKGKDNRSQIVHIPELVLASGSCTALSGASGSGKTSVLELSALMNSPASVDVFNIAGIDVEQISRQGSLDTRAAFRAEHVSFTVQSGGVLPFLTAEENILASYRVLGRSVDASVRKKLLSIAAELKVDASLSKRRSELSGGERYRIGLLRSLLVPRSLVLADEPTAALDVSMSATALQLLTDVADKNGSAVLIATHDVKLAQGAGFAIHRLQQCDFGYRVEESS